MQKAIALEKLGMPMEAMKWYEKVLALDSNQFTALHHLARLEIENGKPEKAIRLIQKAIAADGIQAGYLKSLGDAFRRQKNFPKATACYRKTLVLGSLDAGVFIGLFHSLSAEGMPEEALAMLKKALLLEPDCVEALLLIGNIHLNNTQFEEAFQAFEKTVQIQPENSGNHFYLALALQKLHKYHLALNHYRKALDIDPKLYEAHVNTGTIYMVNKEIESARRAYESALVIKKDIPEALNNLGNLCLVQGKSEEALTWYRKATSAQPGFREARYNLANCLRKNGRYTAAMEQYRQLIDESPSDARLFNGLGVVYKMMKDYKAAIGHFQNAITLNPDLISAYHNLALVYHDTNQYEEAIACLGESLMIRRDFATEIKKCMLIPQIYTSKSEIDDIRGRFNTELDRLLAREDTIQDPFSQVGIANFSLALHGYNEKNIRKKIASFYLKVCPDLNWTSPSLKKQKTDKIVIGMVSRYFHSCTIGNLYHGIINNLAKDKFELILFAFDWKDDSLSRLIAKSADELVHLPNDFKSARKIIARYSMDVVFYPEIGLDPLTYFIAFTRFAPVQCKKGFGVTMGIPAIDYFISSKFTEPSNAAENYSEKLVQLDTLGYFIQRPTLPKKKLTSEQLGLPTDKTTYACLQSLFKLHPDFDHFIGKIFKRDPDAMLLLLDGQHSAWNELIVKRLEMIDPDARQKIFFLPRLPREQFVSLFLLPDAVIDSIYFSGGHTSLECFALGVPVVTWPSSQMAGRLTYGYYRRIGVLDCIAKDADEYAAIAYRLAHDHPWREQIGKKIKQKSSILFENLEDVRELESFFERAVTAAYDGKLLK